jgi:hypothetical protein
VIKIVGEYHFNWDLSKAVNRDFVQQSLYEFLFIENALIVNGKHRDAGSVINIHTHIFVMFL